MPNRKGKLPPIQSDKPLVMRFVELKEPTRAVIATENIVQRWDEKVGGIVNEVLLMDGVVFRGGKDQIPIVDSHDDSTVRNIFGSIQRLAIDSQAGELYGLPVFATDSESQVIAQRMNEGHITDFSITGEPIETIFVPRGEKYVTRRGETITGPALIHTKWMPLNASICATGADVASTVRRSYTELKRTPLMDESLLAELVAMGLPAETTDPNAALAWLIQKLKPAPVENMTPPAEEVPPVENMASPMDEQKPVENALSRQQVEAQIQRALEGDKTRRKEIQAACKLARIERAFADQLCDDGVSVDDARKRILERMATQETGSSVGAEIRQTESADDKFYAAAHDGLIERAKTRSGIKRSLYLNGDKPAQGHDEFCNLNLIRLASRICERQGFPVQRMSNPEIAQAAIGNRHVARKYRVERDNAYHTTGTFPNLMLDAANKTLLSAYEEAEFTWKTWARQGSSVEDFKAINRIRFSESGNPEIVPETQPYPERAMSDSKESYRVEKYGAIFTVSWETIVGDDLDALSRIPAMHGNAMRRMQNKKVYEVLTSNPTMGDGYSLFSSSHASGSNTSGAAAVISETTLNAGFVGMALQKGLNSDAVLGIVPRYLIVPVTIAATALQFTNSMAPPTVGGSAVGTSGTHNLYGPGGGRPLTVVADPTLDAASTSVWYLAADPSTVDTVELSFLAGEETPVLEEEWVMENDVWKYKIRQTFGVKAIDWRGFWRNSA